MSSNNVSKNNNEVITFYSYKGGNGRTMALSNVATLLAQQNSKNKILMIDWDLEAPGLHRFFFQDSLFTSFTIEQVKEIYRNIDERPGLIDLFISLKDIIDEYDDVIDDTIAIQILDQIKFDDFIISTSVNNLYILKAGRFDQKYSDKVNTFNWVSLYSKAPSLIPLFSEKLAKEYNYVLIDSRTGFTDISGICTMLMPQKLVVVFTPNRQSYTGIKDLIRKATTYRGQSEDMRPLLVYPLPSRIEFSRDDLRAYWRYGNDQKGITGYQKIFQDIFKEVYGLDKCDLTEYFEQVQIQQSPNYAYGEEIAILSEKIKDSFSLSKSYEIFTQWLVDSSAPWQSIKSNESLNVDVSEAEAFDSIALELEKKGNIEKALSYYDKSLLVYDKVEYKIGLARTHNKIGSLLKSNKRFDDAIRHFENALEIHKNINDHQNMAKDCTNIGFIYEQKSQYNIALKWYNEALKLYPNSVEALDAKRLLKWKRPNVKQLIFISYSHEDAKVANRLFRDLKEFGNMDKTQFNLFFDQESLLPRQNWEKMIEESINDSQYYIILLSKSSIKNDIYVQKELRIAKDIATKFDQFSIYIIPIRLDNCQIPESLQNLHIIDLFPNYNKGLQNLLTTMGIEIKPKKLPEQQWEYLLTAIDQKKCIPFIGESTLEFFNQIDDQSIITLKELAREWAMKYNYPFEDAQLPKVAQFLAIENGNDTFPKEIVSNTLKRMKPPNFSLDQYDNSPHVMLAQLNLPIYITTNYDLFMEEALKIQGKEPVSEFCRWNDGLIQYTKMEIIPSVFNKKSMYRPSPDKPLVFHLFGSIDFPQSLVLTERDYFDFVTNTNKIEIEKDVIPSILRTQIIHSSLLFIGYNIDDINFRSLFQGALSFMSSLKRNTNNIAVIDNYIIDDDNSREKMLKYLKSYTRNIFDLNLYWGTMQEFVEELQKLWKTFKKNE